MKNVQCVEKILLKLQEFLFDRSVFFFYKKNETSFRKLEKETPTDMAEDIWNNIILANGGKISQMMKGSENTVIKFGLSSKSNHNTIQKISEKYTYFSKNNLRDQRDLWNIITSSPGVCFVVEGIIDVNIKEEALELIRETTKKDESKKVNLLLGGETKEVRISYVFESSKKKVVTSNNTDRSIDLDLNSGNFYKIRCVGCQSDNDWLHLYSKVLTLTSRFFTQHLPKIKEFTLWCYSNEYHTLSFEPPKKTKFMTDIRVRSNMSTNSKE